MGWAKKCMNSQILELILLFNGLIVHAIYSLDKLYWFENLRLIDRRLTSKGYAEMFGFDLRWF